MLCKIIIFFFNYIFNIARFISLFLYVFSNYQILYGFFSYCLIIQCDVSVMLSLSKRLSTETRCKTSFIIFHSVDVFILRTGKDKRSNFLRKAMHLDLCVSERVSVTRQTQYKSVHANMKRIRNTAVIDFDQNDVMSF